MGRARPEVLEMGGKSHLKKIEGRGGRVQKLQTDEILFPRKIIKQIIK